VRAPSGEIDIVALDGDVLCFVEVKARRGDRHGSPEEALDDVKRRRIRDAADEIVRARRLTGRPRRFDLVAVDLSEDGEPVRVRVRPEAM
jgi:putative endonuclease